MRKITKLACDAIINNKVAFLSNTSVIDNKMYLHGNLIAELESDGVSLFSSGWHTRTTVERLNGLLESLDFPRNQRIRIKQGRFVWDDGKPFIEGEKLYFD